jgi:hypothetical protein
MTGPLTGKSLVSARLPGPRPAILHTRPMGDGTLRYAPNAPGVQVGGRKPGAGAYWRRRFIVLGGCLAALAGAAWSLSGALTVQPTRPAASTGTLDRGAGTSPAGTANRRGRIAASNDHAGPGSGRDRGTLPGAAPAPAASGVAGARDRVRPGFCPWHAIVLSVTANQIQFGPVQQPVFRLSVVSTQRTACSFDVGPGHLALLVKAGSARIWSSGDCVSGAGSVVVTLRRGVPATVSIAWNKNRSSPGCGLPVRPVPSGIYSGYGVAGPLMSTPLPIRLR